MIIFLLLWCGLVAAVEVPATTVRIIDGDTIVVRLADADQDSRVRLLWIDTPESKGNAHGGAMPEGKEAKDFLGELLPANTAIMLWGPKANALETDLYGRFLAIVVIRPPDQQDAAQPVLVAQDRLIRAGHSPYWRKYGEAPEPWNRLFLDAQRDAEQNKSGAWGTAEKWMRDKSNERESRKSP